MAAIALDRGASSPRIERLAPQDDFLYMASQLSDDDPAKTRGTHQYIRAFVCLNRVKELVRNHQRSWSHGEINDLVDNEKAMECVSLFLEALILTDCRLPLTGELIRGLPRARLVNHCTRESIPHAADREVDASTQFAGVSVDHFLLLLCGAHLANLCGMTDLCRRLCDELELHLDDDWTVDNAELSSERGLRFALATIGLKASRRQFRDAVAGKPRQGPFGSTHDDPSEMLLRTGHWCKVLALARPNSPVGHYNLGWYATQNGETPEVHGYYTQCMVAADVVEDDIFAAMARIQLGGIMTLGWSPNDFLVGDIRRLAKEIKHRLNRLDTWGMTRFVHGETSFEDCLMSWLQKNEDNPDTAVISREHLQQQPPTPPPPTRRPSNRGQRNPVSIAISSNQAAPPEDDEEATTYRCDHCFSYVVAIRRCSQCRVAQYCSRNCQRRAWKQHKKTCTPPPEET